MNILILEDETAAATRIKQLVHEIVPDASIDGIFETVKESVDWLQANRHPDLIISDIQLADGISFDVFSLVNIMVPVIFTTAYNAYTLKAFKVNSIDYLLKPIDKNELRAAITKYETLKQNQNENLFNNKLINLIQKMNAGHKSRFLVKQADRLITVATEEVSYLKAEDKIVFLFTFSGQRYIIDESLDELERALDPLRFFRLNRKYISPIESIDKIMNHFNGKLRIVLKNNPDAEIYVSREKAGEFKEWLDK
jgi:DNA-binding LytR/AlgR family response regulator